MRALIIATMLMVVGSGVSAKAQADQTEILAKYGKQAREEILGMPEPELRALLSYLSECSGRPFTMRGAINPQPCEAARVRYWYEYSGDPHRAVDSMIGWNEIVMGPASNSLKVGRITPTLIDDFLKNAVRDAFHARRRR